MHATPTIVRAAMLPTMIQPGLVRSVVATLSMTHRLNSCPVLYRNERGLVATSVRSILQVGTQHLENRRGDLPRQRPRNPPTAFTEFHQDRERDTRGHGKVRPAVGPACLQERPEPRVGKGGLRPLLRTTDNGPPLDRRDLIVKNDQVVTVMLKFERLDRRVGGALGYILVVTLPSAF